MAVEKVLYRKIAGTLSKEIIRGDYAVGALLPAESELCQQFDVSRHTIRQALRKLRDDGLVTSRQGAGTIVVRPASQSSYVQTVGSLEELIPYATKNRFDVDASETVTCGTELARKLGCTRGEKWFRIAGFRYPPKEAAPISWTEVYIRPQFSGVRRMLSLRNSAIYLLIEKMYGEQFSEVEQTIRLCVVPKDIAAGLRVKQGANVAEISRVYRLATGTVAMIALNLYPADRFSYSMVLRHQAS